LIGDLFTDKVDDVWEPMEKLYPDGKEAPGSWDAGTPGQLLENRHNELILPDGSRP
jgi:hypothetical protein